MVRTLATLQLKGVLQTGEVRLDGKSLAPDKSLRVVNHSPAGFSWGYGGSGSVQLALAVLIEILPEKKAVAIHQDFKWKFIATLPEEDFEMEHGTRRFRMAERSGEHRAMVTGAPGSRRGPRCFCHQVLWKGDLDGMA
jgi:hypothetical protein